MNIDINVIFHGQLVVMGGGGVVTLGTSGTSGTSKLSRPVSVRPPRLGPTRYTCLGLGSPSDPRSTRRGPSPSLHPTRMRPGTTLCSELHGSQWVAGRSVFTSTVVVEPQTSSGSDCSSTRVTLGIVYPTD